MTRKCPTCKRFRRSDGVYVDNKGYLQITAGPQRKLRVHQLVALAKFGKIALERDIQIHHKDLNKLNCHPDNLVLLREKDHGAVSARQAWWFKTHDITLKESWDGWFEEQDKMIATFDPIGSVDGVPF